MTKAVSTHHRVTNSRSHRTRCRCPHRSTAMSYNETIKNFADRLTAVGKPFEVVVTATMRKLVIILKTIVRNQHPWKEILCVAQNA